tara:strand:- start:1253 stop:1795 length:543 start_codon:yes stop_codon:yes gene_type:complete
MKALIITWEGYQDQEVVYPYYRLREETNNPEDIVIMANVKGRFSGILGVYMESAALTDELKKPELVEKYLNEMDMLVLPGGVKALEKLRQEKHVLDFVYEWNSRNKVIASTCHGAQLMISSKIVKGKKISAYYSIQDDVNNAGAEYVDAPYVIDTNIVSSPHYHWMGEWMKAAIELTKNK